MDIHIIAGKDKASSSVKVTGSVQHVITDEERKSFKMEDAQLKDGVGKFLGKRPKDAYLHSPTPWGDLYKKNSWHQVQTVLVVESAEILEITSTPTILDTHTFTNSSSIDDPAYTVKISETIQKTTSTNWTMSETISVDQKFTYNVGFLGTGGGGETSLSFSGSFGQGGEESKSVSVGSECSLTVDLKSNQSVVAELSASRGVMKVRIRYKAHLTGNTAVNYNPPHRGHHFWNCDIGSVMSAADVPNSLEFTEDIEVGYYSNGKIVLKDGNTGSIRDYTYL